MKPRLNKSSLTLLSKPTTGHRVTLISYQNVEVIEVEIDAVCQDFVYLGRLWVFNEPHTRELKQPVYHEMTAELCQDMRSNAGLVMQIAARYEAQLEALKERIKQ